MCHLQEGMENNLPLLLVETPTPDIILKPLGQKGEMMKTKIKASIIKIILGICSTTVVVMWLIGCSSQADDITIRFVAVGSNGVVIYSTDGGKNWTKGTLGTQDNLFNLFGIATDGSGRWITVPTFPL